MCVLIFRFVFKVSLLYIQIIHRRKVETLQLQVYLAKKENTLIHFNLAEGMIEAIVHMLAKTRTAGCKECWDLFLHIPFVLPLRNLFYALRL